MPLEQKLGLVATIVIITIVLACVAVKATGGLNWQFSEGSRSGVVQKLSKKGVIWKTWEGELNLGYNESRSDGEGRQTIAPAIFYFSVESDEVAKRLKAAEVGGRRVTIDYKQYFLRGWNKGGTSYDIVGCQDATSVTSIQ
jgi:hypothetical protein